MQTELVFYMERKVGIMECPICKNRIGFNCGTCIECGYNYLSNKFDFIKVYVSDLEKYLPEDICNLLVDEHEKYKRR